MVINYFQSDLQIRMEILSILLVSFVLKQVYGFKIDVVPCTTSEGNPGFCREKEHCSYGNITNVHNLNVCEDRNFVCCPNSGKSKKMCIEYADAVYEEPPVVGLRKPVKIASCGINATPLIIGGIKTKIKEFPHMALIGFENSRKKVSWSCGGTLISPRYVLTAAHCMDGGRVGPAKRVRFGILNINELSIHLQEIEVEKRISHPLYKPRVNDIALLKLKHDVKFTPFVRPACLDSEGSLNTKTPIATGWGKTSYEKDTRSDFLLKVRIDIVNNDTCRKTYKKDRFMPRGIERSMLCAGFLAGGKDTCQGDSGGPLQVVMENPFCMYRIIGVTSFGKFCGFANSPAIYSRVFTFLPWIESIVWP